MQGTPPPPLDYAPPPPWNRRRIMRRISAALIALVLLFAAYRYAPIAWRNVRLYYWQQKCLSYTAPADQVVFSSEPRFGRYVHAWQRFYDTLSPPGFQSRATLFVGAVLSPKGNRRLVAVDAIVPIGSDSGPARAVYANGRVFVPGNLVVQPREIDPMGVPQIAGVSYRHSMIIFAGQLDPSDHSHFTIRATVDGTDRIIDGWMRDYDHVILELRRQPTTTQSPPSSQASSP